MLYKQYRLAIPSNDEYSLPQLRMMIREVEEMIQHEIAAEVWNRRQARQR